MSATFMALRKDDTASKRSRRLCSEQAYSGRLSARTVLFVDLILGVSVCRDFNLEQFEAIRFDEVWGFRLHRLFVSH